VVSIDWARAPVGESDGSVRISRTGGESVSVTVHGVRSDKYVRENLQAFGGLTGATGIAADQAMRNIAAGGARWERIPDYGRGASGMCVFPVTAASVTPPASSPRLEYDVLIPKSGDVDVDLVTGPTLNFVPGRGLRVAVSFDEQPPQVLDAFASPDPSKNEWRKSVKDNARVLRSTHKVTSPGMHTLRVWMVDPAVVLEKLVVHTGDLPPSYFGPPEQTAPAAASSAGAAKAN
jgi:hypothetical protein